MTFTTGLIENPTGITFATQLEADLATGVRGGNKARLVARCWVATNYGAECGLGADQYDRFRAEWTKSTYAQIHKAFDQFLPAEYSWKKDQNAAPAAPARTARNGNGMTEAQAKQFERFCNAPARLVKRFLKTADYYASCGNNDHLDALVEKHRNAAELCRKLIGDREMLLILWNTQGFRTSGDLEMWVERTMSI